VSISLSLSNVMLLGLQNEQFLFCWYSSNGFFFFFLLFLFDQCPGEAIEKSENSFEMIIGFIICYAEHGLIQCDFNEFNY